MKLNLDWLKQRRINKRRALAQWHVWFAWRPVQVEFGDWRFMEKVQRKCHCSEYDISGIFVFYTTRYKSLEIEDGSNNSTTK